MVVTVQLLPINVVLAANPVALGVDDVPPLKFTVWLLYAVVPPVPSRAARDTNMPSTDAWLRDDPVNIKLPPIFFNPEFIENVVKLGAVMVNGRVEPTVTNAGKDNVVNIAKFNVFVPDVDDNVANNEKSTDVAAGPVGVKVEPDIVAKDGKL